MTNFKKQDFKKIKHSSSSSDNNNKASLKSTTVVNSNVLFNSGNPIQFAVAKAKIINSFIGENCYEYVSYDMNNPPVPLTEETFDEPEPDHNALVTQAMANMITSTNNHYNAIDAVTAAAALPDLAKQNLINQSKRMDAIHKTNMSLNDIVVKINMSL